MSFAEEYCASPDEIWVTSSSEEALRLVSDWQRSDGSRVERVVIAADSLSLWFPSSQYPLSLWHDPDWLACGGTEHLAIHRGFTRAIEAMLLQLWPTLPAPVLDIMIFDLTYVLAPMLLVSNVVLTLRARGSASVHLDAAWSGTTWLTRQLGDTGASVSTWGEGHSRVVVRSPGRLLGRSWAGMFRYGLPRRLTRASVLFLVTTPYYASKLTSAFVRGLHDDGIGLCFPAFGSSQSQRIVRLLKMPAVSVVDPLAISQQYLVNSAAQRAELGAGLLEDAIVTFAPASVLFAAMLRCGVRSAMARLCPAAVMSNFQGFPEGAALFGAAHELGIPTLLLQAGAFTLVDQYVRPQADYYITRDSVSAQRILEAGVPIERVRDFGTVFRNQVLETTTPARHVPPRIIGVCSGGLYGPSDPDHWNCAAAIIHTLALDRDTRIVVRPHPAESRQAVKAMATAFFSGFDWTFDSSPDIATFLRSVDLVIHDASTVGNDAKEVKTPEISTADGKVWSPAQDQDEQFLGASPDGDMAVHQTRALIRDIVQ